MAFMVSVENSAIIWIVIPLNVICCFTKFNNFLFFFYFRYSWYGYLSVPLTSWQYNSMCFVKFTNYLAILSSNILLALFAFMLFFCKRIYNIVCVLYDSVITALKFLSESSPAHVSWCQLIFFLTPIFLEFGMSAIFKCLGHFDSPVRRLLVLGHPVS